MKYHKKLLASLLAGAILSGAAIPAAAAQTVGDAIVMRAAAGVQTRVTFADGSVQLREGAPDPASLAGKAAAYDLLQDGETLLSVTLGGTCDSDAVGAATAMQNGYYAASFLVAGYREVFLTALSEEKVEEIQARIVSSVEYGVYFCVEDLSFIDAEKQGLYGVDSSLCWAAASANALTYTGWGQQAGFDSEDDLFDAFVDGFTDDGSIDENGLVWFFNGFNLGEATSFISVAQQNDPDNGAYCPDYAYERLVRTVDIHGCDTAAMARLVGELRAGSGVLLGGSFYHEDYRLSLGGHALTCWGYVLNLYYDEDDPERYETLLCVDSDSDPTGSLDRRTAPNALFSLHLDVCEDPEYGTFWVAPYYDNFSPSALTALTAYDPSLERETSPRATRRKQDSPDLSADKAAVGIFAGDDSRTNLLTVNDDVYLHPAATNYSLKDFSGTVTASVQVWDADGKEVFSGEADSEISTRALRACEGFNSIKVGRLPAGSYTAAITLTADCDEAYLYNNSAGCAFEVIDKQCADPGLYFSPEKVGIYLYELHLQPLSAETEARLTACDVYAAPGYRDDGQIIWGDFAYCVFTEHPDGDSLLPERVSLLYPPEAVRFAVKLTFDDGTAAYAQAELTDADNRYFVYAKALNAHDFADVTAGTMTVDEKDLPISASFSLSEGGGTEPVEAKITLCLQDKNDPSRTYTLTEPRETTLEIQKTVSFNFAGFDYPIPAGEYRLMMIAEGNFYGGVASLGAITARSTGEALTGDANLDGTVDITDATLIQLHAAARTPLSGQGFANADVNQNGTVDVTDATLVQLIVAGKAAE